MTTWRHSRLSVEVVVGPQCLSEQSPFLGPFMVQHLLLGAPKRGFGSKILHLNVTRNPNVLWVLQQLPEAWAYKQPHKFLLFDRDAKFGTAVVSAVSGDEQAYTDIAKNVPSERVHPRR